MIPVLLVLIQLGSLGCARWYSRAWLRNTAARLLTRADVLDAQKATHAARLEFWIKATTKERKVQQMEVA
jgi:hypothetical protein